VDDFLKKTNVIAYSRAAFDRDAPSIIRLAELEGLMAHAESVRIRLKKGSGEGETGSGEREGRSEKREAVSHDP